MRYGIEQYRPVPHLHVSAMRRGLWCKYSWLNCLGWLLRMWRIAYSALLLPAQSLPWLQSSNPWPCSVVSLPILCWQVVLIVSMLYSDELVTGQDMQHAQCYKSLKWCIWRGRIKLRGKLLPHLIGPNWSFIIPSISNIKWKSLMKRNFPPRALHEGYVKKQRIFHQSLLKCWMEGHQSKVNLGYQYSL